MERSREQDNNYGDKHLDTQTLDILKICRNIESICAELYFLYAEQFGDNPFLHRLWTKTAGEELNHANIIKLAIGCKEIKFIGKEESLAKYHEGEKIIQGVLALAKASQATPLEALESAIEIEKRLSAFHLDSVVDFRDNQEAEFFKALLESDREHVEALINARTVILRGQAGSSVNDDS